MDTGENETPSFNYKLVENKDVDVEKFIWKYWINKNCANNIYSTFRAVYFFSDSDEFGVLKITGLRKGDDATIKITYKTTSDL